MGNYKLIGMILITLFSLFFILSLPSWVFNFIIADLIILIWFIFLVALFYKFME